jgi:hypothetical protein
MLLADPKLYGVFGVDFETDSKKRIKMLVQQ